MNCQKAKNIDLVQYLKKIGFQPQKTKRENKWFFSPFRSEKTASFKVNTDKNIWYDFGEGCGGTIIDFLQKLHNCSIAEALQNLENVSFFVHQQPQYEIQNVEPKYLIKKVSELTNQNLLDYLSERKINPFVTKQFCVQVHYSFFKDKEYYGIGFMNNSGGIEIRNKFFKGCLGKKEVTTIENNSKVVSLFESWSDFLSYLTLKKKIPNEDFVILNSTALIKRAVKFVESYEIIKTFLDNDEAGDKAFIFLQNSIKQKVVDCRIYYSNYKDLNDFLKNKK